MIRTTGFANGLFNATESDAAQMTDKTAKVGFLDKIISCTYFAVGQDSSDVLPGKIVAGLECEKTNAFLCTLHAAATNYLGNSDSAVQRVLAGDSATGGGSRKPAGPPVEKSPQKGLVFL